MNATIAKREAEWAAFLERWPLESLAGMSLDQYSQAGNQDCFVYWLESKTENLGSIWGGSAFKFGIFSRKNKEDKANEVDRIYGENYAWYAKYGGNPEEAFEKVRSTIYEIAAAARKGKLEEIDDADLGTVVKWKIAFLYQDRDRPLLFPILKADYLRAALGSDEKRVSVLQRGLLRKSEEEGKPVTSPASLFTHADEVWSRIQELIRTELTPLEAKEYFDKSDQLKPIKAPTQKIAGFEAPSGQQIALALDNLKTTVFFNDGPWLKEIAEQLQDIVHYPPEKSRSSNLPANAPKLAVGNPIVKAVVPTMEALIQLCDAICGAESASTSTSAVEQPLNANVMIPLNQILYGPPGTGKTFSAINATLEILAPDFLTAHFDDRDALKGKFDELKDTGHVRFVTFHQSFSYEDFVEGLRPDVDEKGQLRYQVIDGVFKEICLAAAAKATVQAPTAIDIAGRKIWKLSLGEYQGSDAYVFDECIEQDRALIGFGSNVDFKGCDDRKKIHTKLNAAGHIVDLDAYDITALNIFVNRMRVGDLVIVTEGNFKFRAIGEITSDYHLIDRTEQGDTYSQSRAVKWLRVYQPSLPKDQLMNNQFSQMTVYEIKPGAIDLTKLRYLLGDTSGNIASERGTSTFYVGQKLNDYSVIKVTPDLLELRKPNGNVLPLAMSMLRTLSEAVSSGKLSVEDIRQKRVFEKLAGTTLEPNIVNGYNNILGPSVEYLASNPPTGRTKPFGSTPNAKVLIIDEINRGNVSRIFGELITLIEPSKRSGKKEALEVTLPYSKQPFSVPSNLYIIGTMNTADRSLAGLDIALRRRFTFLEMPPRPDLLKDVEIAGINIGNMLKVINERIELLLDRDHRLGHAYFLDLGQGASIEDLAMVFRRNVIPLLQEYFFEDWQRIQWVLNDHRKPEALRFVTKRSSVAASLFGPDVAVNEQSGIWSINDAAFVNVDAYRRITSQD